MMRHDGTHPPAFEVERSIRPVTRSRIPLSTEIAPFADGPAIPGELVAKFLDPVGHAAALTVLATRALQSGQLQAAHAYADRRCRVRPLPTALDFLLRAQTARHRGDAAAFARDLRRAVEIDPTNPLVNFSALAMEDAVERLRAARSLVEHTNTSVDALRAAIACLLAQGEAIVAHVADRETSLRGWVTWPAGEDLVIYQTSGTQGVTYRPQSDPRHRFLARGRAAADLIIPRPDSGAISLRFERGDGPIGAPLCVTLEPRRSDHRRARLNPSQAGRAANLTVIVPVYEDAEATRRCLDSLRRQKLPGLLWRTVVIDDASPNSEIVADLAVRANTNEITLMTNRVNLGFAAAVNLAAEATSGDILLLNADTVLPPGALARLVLVAATTPRVGTITPLSNNGEDTSFPRSFSFNDLPHDAELFAWDRAAEDAGGRALDLPNGIGFCMLIKRPCWEALGGLSRSYGRGYFEDVDLCLRARDHGYRNLCATNVIVGHAGSRSFRANKRALVVRNLAALSVRFPEYQAESAAFFKADPLRPAFNEIERRIPPPRHDVLLVAPAPGTDLGVKFRTDELRRLGKRCLILKIAPAIPDRHVSLQSAEGGIPQSLTFALDRPQERSALLDYLRASGIQGAEWMDPGLSEDIILDLLDALDCPTYLYLSEALMGPVPCQNSDHRRARFGRTVQGDGCSDPGGLEVEDAWLDRSDPVRAEVARGLLARVVGVICSDAMAFANARQILALDWPITRGGHPGEFPRRPRSHAFPGTSLPSEVRTLGILSPAASVEVTNLVLALSRHFRSQRTEARICVIGATQNDLALMACGNVFVTGAASPTDLDALAAIHRPAAMVLPYRASAFHALEVARDVLTGAWAYYDWSCGGHAGEDGDLALPPDLDTCASAETILHWFGKIFDRQS